MPQPPIRLALTGALASLLLGCAAAPRAEAPGPRDDYAAGRAVIADLGRIVSPRGIQESYTVRLGGIEQWVYARGQDSANPVILFVHGGPASPMAPAAWQFQRPIEEYFTVVHWDQRGAGRTLLETDTARVSGTISIARYVEDAIELAEYVRRRYGAEKLVLAGHSWGTIVGMHAALRRPDLFSAYVGIGQVISTAENERLSYDYAVEQATLHGDTAALRELASIAPYPGDEPITRERIVSARRWAQHYGGLSAWRSESRYFFHAPLLSPEYPPDAVAAIDQGSLFTLEKILPEFLAVDFTGVREFPIPVIMLMGRHDYTTPSQPTAEWLAALEAPYKRGVWFERSAHMIPFEEPGKLLVTLVDQVRPIAVAAEAAAR